MSSDDIPVARSGDHVFITLDRGGEIYTTPRASVCLGGHVISARLTKGPPSPFCQKCGKAVIMACPGCSAYLRELTPPESAYYNNCSRCGVVFPWRKTAIVQAKRALRDQAAAEGWDAESHARASELLSDIEEGTATPERVAATLAYFKKTGKELTNSIFSAVLDEAVKAGIRHLGMPIP